MQGTGAAGEVCAVTIGAEHAITIADVHFERETHIPFSLTLTLDTDAEEFNEA